MLRCEKCSKYINLGLTEKEEQDIADELRIGKAVMVCIECYEDTTGILQSFKDKFK